MDMPISTAAEAQGGFSLGAISQTVADLSPVIDAVRRTWSKQSFEQMRDGRFAVPDDVINDSLAKYSDENSEIYGIRVTSQADGKLRLYAETKKFGRVDLLCRINQFEHTKDISLLKFTVLEKDMPDNQVLSWMFSRVSLSMAEKLVGKIDLGDTVRTKIVGDTVAIDFHDALLDSSLGQTNLFGFRLTDAVTIESAEPKDGYIEFKTSLQAPETVKLMLQNILK